MKRFLKKFIPKQIFSLYHLGLALLGTVLYGIPTRKMVVIGVTGTKGKTSAANFIWATLQASGFKTGIITTANIRIGENEVLNKYHMTMPGRFVIQKTLSQMVKEGCTHAVVETTSEGLKQFRHIGIFYDIAVFTNLTSEHLESHGGSFEEYKKMKGKLFQSLGFGTRKKILGEIVPKVSVINIDDEYADFFLSFPSDKKITFGLSAQADYQVGKIKEKGQKVSFSVLGEDYEIKIAGAFNVPNALPAIIITKLFGAGKEKIQDGFNKLSTIPGRMEFVNSRQNFQVVVDYAHEKESMTKALGAVKNMVGGDGKVIVLLGAEGGGRDKSKRPIMGEIAGELADYVIISNVDPYDDDPAKIAQDIAESAQKKGKTFNKDLFVILDRREGIKKALSLASDKDIVLITCKGAEQSMIIGQKRVPWDDRIVAREELKFSATLPPKA